MLHKIIGILNCIIDGFIAFYAEIVNYQIVEDDPVEKDYDRLANLIHRANTPEALKDCLDQIQELKNKYRPVLMLKDLEEKDRSLRLILKSQSYKVPVDQFTADTIAYEFS